MAAARIHVEATPEPNNGLYPFSSPQELQTHLEDTIGYPPLLAIDYITAMGTAARGTRLADRLPTDRVKYLGMPQPAVLIHFAEQLGQVDSQAGPKTGAWDMTHRYLRDQTNASLGMLGISRTAARPHSVASFSNAMELYARLKRIIYENPTRGVTGQQLQFVAITEQDMMMAASTLHKSLRGSARATTIEELYDTHVLTAFREPLHWSFLLDTMLIDQEEQQHKPGYRNTTSANWLHNRHLERLGQPFVRSMVQMGS